MGSTPPKSILVKVSSFYFVSSFLLLFLCVFPSFSSTFFSISVGPTTTTSLSAAAAGLGTWQMDQNGQNLNSTEFAAGHANISTSTRPTTRRQALLMNSTPSDTQVPPLDDNSPTPRPLRRQSFIASPGANAPELSTAVPPELQWMLPPFSPLYPPLRSLFCPLLFLLKPTLRQPLDMPCHRLIQITKCLARFSCGPWTLTLRQPPSQKYARVPWRYNIPY